MSFIPDSRLVDSVLPAEAFDRRGAPILGVVIHMAEGGGTDTWLTRIDGNSSHYVVKYSGKLVQQVPESKAAGSMNPRLTRTTDDRALTQAGVSIRYGRTALDAVLGKYAPIYVNRAVIAIETEGFASDGPNAAQTVTLVSLVKDIINRRGHIGLLGHRDQQAYKACPGRYIPWNLLGGHGVITTSNIPEAEDDVKFIQASGLTPAPSQKLLRLPIGTPLYGFDGAAVTKTASVRDWPYVGLVDAHSGQKVILAGTSRVYDDGVTRPTLLVARTGTLVDPPPSTPADCSAEVAAAVTADRAKARIVYT